VRKSLEHQRMKKAKHLIKLNLDVGKKHKKYNLANFRLGRVRKGSSRNPYKNEANLFEKLTKRVQLSRSRQESEFRLREDASEKIDQGGIELYYH
jgi:hypothetical protein